MRATLLTFKKNKTQFHEKESGAAMIFAVILLIMLVSVSIFVASAALTQANVTKTQSIRAALITGSNNGIEWALSTINSSAPLNGVTPAIDGMTRDNPYLSSNFGDPVEISGVKNVVWKVWAEKVVTANNELSYYIYSKAYSVTLGESRSLTQRAIVESTTITGSNSDTKDANGNPIITYQLNGISALSQGIFTNQQMTVNGNAKVYAYNSLREGSTPSGTKKSTVATNGFVQIAAPDLGVERIIAGLETANTGCFPTTICNQTGAPAVSYRDTNLGFSTLKTVEDLCGSATTQDWKATANGGVLAMGDGDTNRVKCVNNLIFDANTTVSGMFTSSTPLTVIVKGNVTVTNGAKVNWGFSPQRLRIIGVGGTFDVAKASNPSLSFLYASEGANCRIGTGTTTGTATFFGALACGNITLEPGNKIFIDTATYALANDPGTGTKVWFKVYQEELEDKS